MNTAANSNSKRGLLVEDQHDSDAWHVHVFRYSKSQGWELYQEATGTTSISDVSNHDQQHSKKHHEKKVAKVTPSKEHSSHHEDQTNTSTTRTADMMARSPMTVVPKKGCVEVKKLRLRVHLFVQHHQQQCNEDGTLSHQQTMDCVDYVHTSIIRRRNMISLSPRTGLGAVVLQFKSIAESLAFTDRLLELNAEFLACCLDHKTGPPKSVAPHHRRPTTTSSSSASNKMRRLDQKEGKVNRRKGEDSFTPISSTNTTTIARERNFETRKNSCGGVAGGETQSKNKNNDTTTTTTNSSPEKSERKALIQSYIVKLLHDQDFLDFVDGVEENLLSTSDCSDILKALEYPRGVPR